MAWFKGVATDYKDLLDQLATLGEDEHVATASVYDGGTGYALNDTISISGGTANDAPELEVVGVGAGDTVNVPSIVAGGTGYAVGDTLYIDGGTYAKQAILEVTTEAAGVVTGLQVNDPGIYSAQPAGTLTTTAITGSGNDDLTVTVTWNTSQTGIVTDLHISNAGAYTATPASPVATTTSGSGVGLKAATTYVETAWETLDLFDVSIAVSATVATGGTGYISNQYVTVEGGTWFKQAQFRVTAVAGAVTALTLVSSTDEGLYYTVPSNPAVTTTGGLGTGCTINITWDSTESRRLYLHNTVTDVYLGIRTVYNSTYSAYCWRLTGFTGYNSHTVSWPDQPGYSGDEETLVPLANTSINYWFSISNNRILGTFEIGSSFPNMYMGLLEPYLTAAEYPYPLMILGCATRQRPASESLAGGMVNPGAHTYSPSTIDGPGRIRRPNGSWENIFNWYATAADASTFTDVVNVQPAAMWNENPGLNYGAMAWYEYSVSADDRSWEIFFQTGSFSDSTRGKLQGVNGEYVLVPITLAYFDDRTQYGAFEDVFWFDNFDYSVASKDRILVNGVRYMVFHNCTHAYRGMFFCVREA